MMEYIKFQPNIPETVALRYATGKRVTSIYKPYQVQYSFTDGRGTYADPELHVEIEALAPKAGEPFTICKQVNHSLGQSRVTWKVERIDKTRSPQRPADPHPPAAAATNNNNAQEAPPRHRQTTQGQFQDIPTKMPMDEAALRLLIAVGRAKREAERVLGFPVDQVIQDLASTLYIHASKEGWITWLSSASVPAASPAAPVTAAPVIDTGGNPPNSKAAQKYVADQKISDLQKKAPAIAASAGSTGDAPWRNEAEMGEAFAALRENLGEMRYIQEMTLAGVKAPQQLRYLNQRIALYERLVAIARLEEAC